VQDDEYSGEGDEHAPYQQEYDNAKEDDHD
jgi:hypothetical protein